MGRSGIAALSALFVCAEGVRIRKSAACGVKGSSNQSNTAIVNGEAADECEWSWQVGFQRNGQTSFFCGGMLIDPEWVLTAAHCLNRGKWNFKVVAGAYSMKTSNDTHRQVRIPVNPIVHVNYTQSKEDYDFALVKLDSAVNLGHCVGTVCLPVGDIDPGSTCWITGWGTLQFRGSQPDILQEAPVVVRSNDDCGNYQSNKITDRMLCAQGAGINGGITDACQGDSGGPLVCEVDGTWVLHGATSWGAGCAGANYAGVWAKVSNQLTWIEETMADPPQAFPPTPRPPTPAPVPTPGPPPCPQGLYGPDSAGDCKCDVGKCSLDGGLTYNCPTSSRPGAFGGTWFLSTCGDACQCYATTTTTPAPTPVPPPGERCPSFAANPLPDRDGDCRCKYYGHKCSRDGGWTFMCPTSGVNGGYQGRYFLPSCKDCKCYDPRATPVSTPVPPS